MKLSEAYQELEIPETTTPEEAKKAYRKLASKYHPDVNKDQGSEAKFKLINQAYQCIQNGHGDERQQISSHQGWSHFHQQQIVEIKHIEVNLAIQFKEAVLGCKKELKYNRQIKCQPCDGSGDVKLNNGCKKCNGMGHTTIRQHGMIFATTCSECHGRAEMKECSICKGEGTVHTDISVNVAVPPGILNGSTLRLSQMGNYAGSVLGLMEQYSDAYCHIAVIPEEGLSIQDRDVISHLTLPLLDALVGTQRSVKTIFGSQEITIPAQSKHKEEVIIPKHGVEGLGNQRVILNVEYPPDINHLIETLANNTAGQLIS